MMELVAVAKSGVHVYKFQPDDQAAPVDDPAHSFPAVPTAEGCVWSSDGNLLGLVETATGGAAVYDAADDYAKLCAIEPLVGGPVRNFYFSPLGNHLVTHERWVKDGGPNVGVWDAKTGELKMSFILKKLTEMTWPPLKWTNLETHCCRMVQDGVVVLPGNLSKEEGAEAEKKILAPGIMAFEVAPRGPGTNPPHVAICIAESKGAPARCQIIRLDDSPKMQPTATKNFFKAQTVSMQWNNVGTAMLVRTSQEVDDTGKSYYGGSHLYFMRADGEESCIVASPDDGAIHDVQWSPTQDEFFLLHGDLPCNMTLHEGRKGQKRVEFGRGHRNTIRWNNFGRFLVCGGYGQLLGDTDFWDKPGKTLMGSARLECCVVSAWSPEGRHFLAATTSPRMRVDNKIVIYDYCGSRLASLPFEELLLAGWRPRPRGAFQDRPPSPGREKAKPKAGSSGGGYPAEPKKQAYRPPGARGGGGLAEMLRKELGSTQAEVSKTATKIGAASVQHSLPPGAAPDAGGCSTSGGGGGAAASRNARKKKAKEAAQASTEDSKQQTLAAALAPQAAAAPPPAAAKAAAVAKEAPAPAAAAAADAPSSDNPEVEKKVRALRKKLRDIAKLKEQDPAKLDPLQREKISGEPELVRQIRDLGAEP